MATTELTAICSTPHLALDYYMRDKIELINSADEVNKEAPHKIYEENGQLYVKYFTFTSFLNCDMQYPYSSFAERQAKWQNVKYNNNGVKTKKGKEPLMYELRQSFNGWEVSFEVANEIGRKLAEELFSDYVVTVSTHGNTGSVHNHIAISAWDDNGKKLNDCHDLKRAIRRVSDRLCEEYGLSVLEETRDMKLVRWKDKNGVTRYYEPTDRKNKLIAKREKGEGYPDDVGSYRNTEGYVAWSEYGKKNCDEIKKDIDSLLPSCKSYEELLIRLRELGYTIRDKKKNGEWLSHISFKAPTHLKATREDRLGDGEFYIRENLEKYIAENARGRNGSSAKVESEADVFYFGEYEYGKTDISKIDFNYKAVMRDGEIKIEKRSEAEQRVIADVVQTDSRINGMIDTSGIRRIIENKKMHLSPDEAKAQKLIKQIQDSFRCLSYAERYNIYSYEQIIYLYQVSKNKFSISASNFNKIEKSISELKRILSLPDRAKRLRNRITSSINEAERKDISKELSEIEILIKKYGIGTPEGYKSLQVKVNEFEMRQAEIEEGIGSLAWQMQELENCVRTFDRIDSALGNRNITAVREFYSLVNSDDDAPSGTGNTAPSSEGKKQKGHDER